MLPAKLHKNRHEEKMLSMHPCFNKDVHRLYGRIHLPVAPACNISCGFCDRKYSCVNESRPGVSARVLDPQAAAEWTAEQAAAHPELRVAGIAGPGDPLANPQQTLTALRLVRSLVPRLLLCLSTNGLALPQYADELIKTGVTHATVTVNAVSPETGALIYRQVRDGGNILEGQEGAALLLSRQREGIRLLKAGGVTVKVNTVIVPGINDSHAAAIAETVRSWGADLMNCIPLIPVKGTALAPCGEPAAESMRSVREQAERFLPQMRHCMRCRADACGLLLQKGMAERTALASAF